MTERSNRMTIDETRLREAHTELYTRCAVDNQVWPCNVIELLNDLRDERAARQTAEERLLLAESDTKNLRKKAEELVQALSGDNDEAYGFVQFLTMLGDNTILIPREQTLERALIAEQQLQAAYDTIASLRADAEKWQAIEGALEAGVSKRDIEQSEANACVVAKVKAWVDSRFDEPGSVWDQIRMLIRAS